MLLVDGSSKWLPGNKPGAPLGLARCPVASRSLLYGRQHRRAPRALSRSPGGVNQLSRRIKLTAWRAPVHRPSSLSWCSCRLFVPPPACSAQATPGTRPPALGERLNLTPADRFSTASCEPPQRWMPRRRSHRFFASHCAYTTTNRDYRRHPSPACRARTHRLAAALAALHQRSLFLLPDYRRRLDVIVLSFPPTD